MQRLIRLQIQRPRQHDFSEFPAADSRQSPRHHHAIITGLRRRETGGRLLPTLHPIGLTIPEALKLRMGPPHPVRQRGEIHLRRDQKIRHCGRRRSRLGHLPARHKHPRRRKSLSRLNLITEREPRKKMRTAKRRVHIAHRDCLRERLVDETLHGRKSLRPLRLKRHRHFRSGNRGLNPRSFRIEMRLTRLKNRLQHRQRIKRVDRQRDAHQLGPARAHRRISALRQKCA